MSSMAGTWQAPQPPGGEAEPVPPGREQAGGLSLVSATALVIGSIIWRSRRARAHGEWAGARPGRIRPKRQKAGQS